MKVDDFLDPENENVIDEQFTDEEIIELFCREREVEIEDEDESSEPPPVSIKEATESLNKLIRFLLGQEGNYSKEIDNIMKVSRVLERLKVKSLVQKGLDDYFVIDEK